MREFKRNAEPIKYNAIKLNAMLPLRCLKWNKSGLRGDEAKFNSILNLVLMTFRNIISLVKFLLYTRIFKFGI